MERGQGKGERRDTLSKNKIRETHAGRLSTLLNWVRCGVVMIC